MPVKSMNALFLLGLIYSNSYSCKHLTNSYVGIFDLCIMCNLWEQK